MNKPSKVRNAFTELRAVLGDSISAMDALELASALVDIFDDTNEGADDWVHGPAPFDERPLTQVFADGGWRVLNRAARLEEELEREEHLEMMYHQGLARLSMEYY